MSTTLSLGKSLNEGLRKAKDLAAERLGGITQGMGLPPGLGL